MKATAAPRNCHADDRSRCIILTSQFSVFMHDVSVRPIRRRDGAMLPTRGSSRQYWMPRIDCKIWAVYATCAGAVTSLATICSVCGFAAHLQAVPTVSVISSSRRPSGTHLPGFLLRHALPLTPSRGAERHHRGTSLVVICRPWTACQPSAAPRGLQVGSRSSFKRSTVDEPSVGQPTTTT